MKATSIEENCQEDSVGVNDKNESVGQQSSHTAIAGDVGTGGGDFTGRDRVSIHVNIYNSPLLPSATSLCPLSGHVSVMCGCCNVATRNPQAEYERMRAAIRYLLHVNEGLAKGAARLVG